MTIVSYFCIVSSGHSSSSKVENFTNLKSFSAFTFTDTIVEKEDILPTLEESKRHKGINRHLPSQLSEENEPLNQKITMVKRVHSRQDSSRRRGTQHLEGITYRSDKMKDSSG